VSEALRHALEAGDLDLATRVIAHRLRDVLNHEDRPTLEHWLSVLPEEAVQRRPWLLMAKAWALQLSWQLGRRAKVLSQVEALIDEDGGATLPAEDLQLLRGQILTQKAVDAYHSNQPAAAWLLRGGAGTAAPDWTYIRGATWSTGLEHGRHRPAPGGRAPAAR